MSLTKEQRDALPAADFAVPGKRALPIHDPKHVRMAWDMVDRTKDLSDGERSEARRRILEKAKSLGVDTSDWATVKAMALDAMSLEVPVVEGHPNKMPFRGILTRIDQPSDKPPHGSGGRRVVLPREVAAAALPSLLGMAVDFTPRFDGHDAQKKIGIIDEAVIEGDAIHVGGFVYAADFPDTAASIRANKDRLGFSYEMKNVRMADPSADTLVIESCVFTGAAILNKADAAYETTSLAASTREPETLDMTKEEMEAIIAGALKPVTDEIAALKAGQEKVATDLAASKETHSKVAPHADKLRAAADGMQAAGIGTHETRGHVAHLRQMADRMEAEAMLGKIPHIYRDHDFFVDAGAEKAGTKEPAESPEVKKLNEQIAALSTQVADLKASATRAAQAPERKTVPAEVTALLSKFSLEAGADGKMSVETVDKTLEASGASRTQRIEAKLKLREAGLLA